MMNCAITGVYPPPVRSDFLSTVSTRYAQTQGRPWRENMITIHRQHQYQLDMYNGMCYKALCEACASNSAEKFGFLSFKLSGKLAGVQRLTCPTRTKLHHSPTR